MGLLPEFKEAFTYTKSMLQRPRELLYLIIITIIPILDFAALGYCTKILREDLSSKTPPKIGSLVELLVPGLKVLVLVFVWALIIFIVGSILGIDVLGGISLLIMNPKFAFASGENLAYDAVNLGGLAVVTYLFGLIAIMSIVNMVKQGSFLKAIDFKAIISKIGKIGWVTYLEFVFSALVVGTICSLIVGAVMDFVDFRGIVGIFADVAIIVTLISFVFVLPIIFYAKTASRLYDNSLEKPRIPNQSEPQAIN
jgi:hypothetical protein